MLGSADCPSCHEEDTYEVTPDFRTHGRMGLMIRYEAECTECGESGIYEKVFSRV